MVKIFIEIKNQLNKDIKNKFDELETEKNKFIEAAGGFCIEWVRGYAKRKALQYNLQVSEKLGSKLREFKHEVDVFCQIVPELVKKEFSQKNYWHHYKISHTNAINPKEFKASYHINGIRGPQILDRGMRMATGKLGIILKKYGYLDPEKDSTDRWEQESGVFCYPFPLTWSKELSNITEVYAKKLEEFQELNFKLLQTIKEEKEHEIKMNWY